MTRAAALGSGKAVGLEVAIYKPRLDSNGAAGRGLATVLVDVFGRADASRSNRKSSMPL